MAYARGNFGLEYDPSRRTDGERPLLRGTLVAVAVLGTVAFVTVRGCVARLKLPDLIPPPVPADAPAEPSRTSAVRPASPSAVPQVRTNDAPRAVRPPPPVPLPEPALRVRRWLAGSADRPVRDRNLLERLFEAERTSNAGLARATLVKLRQSPAMADLDEPLARRLGTLNWQLLFSHEPTVWTKNVSVRPSDTCYRVAREHGTTVAAVCALNGLSDAHPKLTVTVPLRVLEFPKVALVIHRQTKQADLSLNGQFFRRFYASVPPHAKVGSYAVTRETGPRQRFEMLSVRFAPKDLDDIALMLAPSATIVVTDP